MTVLSLDDVDILAATIVALVFQHDFIDHVFCIAIGVQILRLLRYMTFMNSYSIFLMNILLMDSLNYLNYTPEPRITGSLQHSPLQTAASSSPNLPKPKEEPSSMLTCLSNWKMKNLRLMAASSDKISSSLRMRLTFARIWHCPPVFVTK